MFWRLLRCSLLLMHSSIPQCRRRRLRRVSLIRMGNLEIVIRLNEIKLNKIKCCDGCSGQCSLLLVLCCSSTPPQWEGDRILWDFVVNHQEPRIFGGCNGKSWGIFNCSLTPPHCPRRRETLVGKSWEILLFTTTAPESAIGNLERFIFGFHHRHSALIILAELVGNNVYFANSKLPENFK